MIKGRGEAAKHRADEATVLAYTTAYFTRTDKDVRLADYLVAAKPRQQSPDEMLAALFTHQARGAGMSIRQLH